jgi:tryptophan synthase alpha chain
MAACLAVYFPLADPRIGPELLGLYAEAGVDVIECGWPAREPYLDGPDVRAAMARATGDPAAALVAVRERLPAGPKILVMTYAEFDHALAGADAVLAVAPPDDPCRMALEAKAGSVAAFLPLPLAPDAVAAARRADFYVMQQAAHGFTGPRARLDPVNAGRIAHLRREGIAAPILLGFGVANGDHARAAIDLGADGVVVGSAALRAALAGPRELAALLLELRRGLDG